MTDGGAAKIDPGLRQALARLGDRDPIDVLVYPRRLDEAFERVLARRRDRGLLVYNLLPLAQCAAVRTTKAVVLDLASEPQVVRITGNPRFTVPR